MSGQQPESIDQAPGAVLSKYRQKAGLSVREVAERLNLMASHVEALEANDFSRLNGELFVRGYVRSYARLLELSERSLLQATDDLLAMNSKQPATGAVTSQVDSKIQPRRRPVVLRPVAALVIAVLVWSLAVYLNRDVEPVEALVELLPEPVDPLPFDVVTPLGAALLERASGGRGVDRLVMAQAGAQLSLVFNEDCWVHIRDAAGETVLSGLQKQGAHLVLDVKAPVDIVLAYWPAVTLSFNNQRIALENHAMGNAMRLRLGDGV